MVSGILFVRENDVREEHNRRREEGARYE